MMKKYPIHDTSGGAMHGEIVPGRFSHNPIPEGETAVIEYEGLRVKVRTDMNFYSDPAFAVFEILNIERIE